MSKSRSRSKLLTEVQKELSKPSESIKQTKEEKSNNNLEVEHEIECSRCHDIMTLLSDFDSLCYRCEECDFLLYLD